MKIILAVDGSPCSQKAEVALRTLPLPESVQLKIVTVCPSADLHAMSSVPETIQLLVDQCRGQALALLNEVAARCQQWCPQIETELLDGHPVREVVLAADRDRADLIVVGARGQGVVSRFFLGSVSDGIAQQAHCSVLVVRHNGDEEVAEPPVVRRILLAYDASPVAEAAAWKLASLPLTSEHTVLIRSVIERAPYAGLPVAATVYELLRNELEPQIDRIADALRKKTPHVSSTMFVAAHVADDLIDAASKQKIDLVVMGSTGKTAWERMFLGSVTTRVLHHVHCSVWIERPTQTTT